MFGRKSKLLNSTPNIENRTSNMTFVYGDNIDTDRIIAGKYTKTLDMNTLAEHVLNETIIAENLLR